MKIKILIELDDVGSGSKPTIEVVQSQPHQIDEGFPPEEDEIPSEDPVAEEVEGEDPKASASRSVTKREASIRRGFKVFFYAIFGQLLAFGGAIAASVAGLANIPPEVAALIGFFISGFAAAVHKAINWQDAMGEAPPEPEVMPVPQLSQKGSVSKDV